MPHIRRTPLSYDAITRATVPEPDSSFRPTLDQERAALLGERILSFEELALYGAVVKALAASGVDVSLVTIDIEGTGVTLRGRVENVLSLPQLESAVRAIPTVGDIVDLVVIGPRRQR